MKTQSLLQNKVVIVALAVAGIGVFYVFGQIQSKGTKSYFSELAPVNYIMGKVKSKDHSEYSLEGREIDNQYLAIQKKQAAAKAKEEAKKAAETKAKKTEMTKAQDKQKADLKKRAEAQRQAFAKQYAYRNMMAARSAQAKMNEARKSTMAAQAAALGGVASAQSHNQTAQQNNPEEKPKKTLEQWRAELYASPTNEFIAKMTAALKSGEITENNYYMLVTELVNSEDSKMIGLGLYALRSNPSVKSFSMLVSLETSVNSTYLKYVQDSLISYHKASQRGVLTQALASNDRTLVKRTLQILKVGMTNIQSGQASTMMDPRDVRDQSSTAFSMTGYSSMLPVLEAILTSGDAELAQLAQQNIDLIDNGSMVASN